MSFILRFDLSSIVFYRERKKQQQKKTIGSETIGTCMHGSTEARLHRMFSPETQIGNNGDDFDSKCEKKSKKGQENFNTSPNRQLLTW